MTISRRRTANAELDDDLLRAAIGLGLGFTNDEAAKFAGKSVDVVKRYKTDPPLQKIIAHVEAAMAIKRSKSIGEAVTDATDKAEDRIKRIFTRSLAITERLVKKAESQGDGVSIEDAMAIHEKITVWASKFAASEAPKRLQIDSTSKQTIVQIVGLADAANVIAAMKQVRDMHPKALITDGEHADA